MRNKMSIKRVAEFLDISISTLKRWDKEGDENKLLSIAKDNTGQRLYYDIDIKVFKNKLKNRPRILVVDDEQTTISKLKGILEYACYNVVAESNAIYAVENIFDEFLPDLVTMDIEMPGINCGYDAVEKILAKEPNTEIIMISSKGQRRIVLDFVRKGAKDFIVKPFTEEYVLKTIDKVLNS